MEFLETTFEAFPTTRGEYRLIIAAQSWHYTDFLRTRSDHRMLASDKREDLLDEVARSIDAHGGRLDIGYEAHLYMAHPINRN